MRDFYALPGIAKLVAQLRRPSRTSCSATPTATRTAASSRASGSSTAPRPRWRSCSPALPEHRHAAVPRARRHGRTRRRPELRGHPRAAAGHGERPDPPDRAGRGDRREIRQSARSAGVNLELLVAATLEATLLSDRASAAARSFSTPRRSLSQRRHGGLSRSRLRDAGLRRLLLRARRRSPKSPRSTSARVRPRANRRAGSRICARFPWSFSWGQARVALPGWYGFGSAIAGFLAEDRDARLAAAAPHERRMAVLPRAAVEHRHDPVEDRPVDRPPLCRAGRRTRRCAKRIFGAIEAEHAIARVSALEDITGASERLADNPALARSLKHRFPYIAPLNYLQVELIRRWRAGETRRRHSRGDSHVDQRHRGGSAQHGMSAKENDMNARLGFLRDFAIGALLIGGAIFILALPSVQNFLAAASAAGDGALATARRDRLDDAGRRRGALWSAQASVRFRRRAARRSIGAGLIRQGRAGGTRGRLCRAGIGAIAQARRGPEKHRVR